MLQRNGCRRDNDGRFADLPAAKRLDSAGLAYFLFSKKYLKIQYHMADSNDQLEGRAQPSQFAGLNGIWFRRECERIAMGRPAIAAHLGVPVGRVAALETKCEAVPAPWWPLLPALGFQHPRLLPSSQEGSPILSVTEPAPRAEPPVPVLAEGAAALQIIAGYRVKSKLGSADRGIQYPPERQIAGFESCCAVRSRRRR